MQEKLNLLITESNNPDTIAIDTVSTLDMVRMINREDHKVADAVEKELAHIAEAIDRAVPQLKAGGRLLYIGAGTSGRLGIIDACECNPTYGTPQEMVEGIIAGGYEAIYNASLGNEDNIEAGHELVHEHRVNQNDVCVGITASGRTPYVLAAMEEAHRVGAVTVGICNNPDSRLSQVVDVTIAPVCGPEAVQGSTRMKAGTSQKMVLNMLSTGIMIRLGKVYKNLMVDLIASNDKLYDRARRLVMSATGEESNAAARALEACGYHVKTAIVMLLLNISADQARTLLAEHDGYVSKALQARGK